MTSSLRLRHSIHHSPRTQRMTPPLASDTKNTVHAVNRIQDRTGATLNGRSFYKTLDVAFNDHVCAEVTRILDLPENEPFMSPSNGLIEHILRWVVTEVTDRWAAFEWRYEMRDKVKLSLQWRYGGGGGGDGGGVGVLVVKGGWWW